VGVDVVELGDVDWAQAARTIAVMTIDRRMEFIM
jgi:hypothetical protein